jgi:C-terminal peptidase prc
MLTRCLLVGLTVAVGVGCWIRPCTAEDPPADDRLAVQAPHNATDFSRLVEQGLELILKHHIDPPTRQELLLGGARALHDRAPHDDAPHNPAPPLGLAREISALATAEQVQAYLNDLAEPAGAGPSATPEARSEAATRFLQGALDVARDGSNLQSPLSFGRSQSIRENRYVGIGIALANQDGWPKMASVFPGGPAHKADIPDGAIILEVDGESTEGKSLEEVVVMLTGPKGSSSRLLIRHPSATDPRQVTLVRDVIPFRTVVGVGGNSQSPGKFTLDAALQVGYANIMSIGPSTTHELRELERQLVSAGCRALIIDLRSAHQARLHDGVILADALLREGTIGRSRDVGGEHVYAAQADELFVGWPVVVLVDSGTHGVAEWVAAAWQDNRRALVVGQATSGNAWCTSGVELPGGLGAMELRTDLLIRGDGRALLWPGGGFVMDADGRGFERLSRRQAARHRGPSSDRGGDAALGDEANRANEASKQQSWGVTPDRQLAPWRPTAAGLVYTQPPGGAVPLAPLAPRALPPGSVPPNAVVVPQAAPPVVEDPVTVAAEMLKDQLQQLSP